MNVHVLDALPGTIAIIYADVPPHTLEGDFLCSLDLLDEGENVLDQITW